MGTQVQFNNLVENNLYRYKMCKIVLNQNLCEKVFVSSINFQFTVM
jgi:hypothetical protein